MQRFRVGTQPEPNHVSYIVCVCVCKVLRQIRVASGAFIDGHMRCLRVCIDLTKYTQQLHENRAATLLRHCDSDGRHFQLTYSNNLLHIILYAFIPSAPPGLRNTYKHRINTSSSFRACAFANQLWNLRADANHSKQRINRRNVRYPAVTNTALQRARNRTIIHIGMHT